MHPEPANAAIAFWPDGYVLSGAKLMGRQAAGNAFLRAAVAGRQEQPLWAYTAHKSAYEIFRKLVQEIDRTAESAWLPADRLDMVAQLGTLYLPGPGLIEPARLRLRAGPSAYSLCGVTHTTASHTIMDSLVGMLTAPVMEWDAIICTSRAVVDTVRTIIANEVDFLHWRLGSSIRITVPQLPMIPLGVHCADYVFTSEDRNSARQALGISAHEVVALFVGRLSFHAKAHPHAMYLGLQAAAERTGQKIVLIQSGWFANAKIESAFKSGAATYCPNARAIFTDGRDPNIRRQCWAAADLFISLSDNIQETFGLTPIEAMAAGLPAVVSDWDGYKDTVRHGIDGFRIPTWMPPPPLGEIFARRHESGIDDYDLYVGLTCQTISVDLRSLTQHLTDLVSSPELRHRLGDAGQRRAREAFDWPIIYKQYKALWMELRKIRQKAQMTSRQSISMQATPRAAASRMDPFQSFRHYPTELIEPTTRVSVAQNVQSNAYRDLFEHPLFTYANRFLPAPKLVGDLMLALNSNERTIEELSNQVGLDIGALTLAISILAKMGLMRLRKGDPYSAGR